MRSTLPFATTLVLALCALPGSAQQPGPSPTTPPKTITVSSGLMASHRIGGDNPEYPAIAKAAHISGTVVLHASISAQGKVDKLTVVSGPAMLQQAAVDAARTWIYQPYVLNGKPVAVQTQINIIFSLGDDSTAQSASEPTAVTGKNGQPLPVHTETVTVSVAGAPEDAAPPAHPVTAEQVHEMLQLTGALQLMKQFLDAMMPAIKQQMPPYMPDDILADFQKDFLGANLEDAITRVYQKHVSTEDAAAAIAFYRTPAGQRILGIQPTLEKELQEEGRQLAVQTMMDVLDRHKSEIDDAKKAYEATHLWTPPKN